MYIIEPTLDPIIHLLRASQNAVSAHFTSKQILVSHSTPPDYSGNMVSKFHVDRIKTQLLTKPAQNNRLKETDKTL